MSNLLYKEWHLAVHSVVYLFLLIGALLLVPAYPYGMIFFFGCLGLYFTSQFARENSDAFYTATLPIKKRHVVKSKCLLFVSNLLSAYHFQSSACGRSLTAILLALRRMWHTLALA